MGLRRASWIGALVLSIAAHGAVVAAFTPDPDATEEAGNGAGSAIEGSIDATLGSDVAVEQFVSEELQTALDTETAPAVEPTTLAELAPATSATVEATAVSELLPVATPSTDIAPVLTADISATPIESDLAAAPAPEPTEIVPTETITAAAPTTPEVAPIETAALTALRPVEELVPLETVPEAVVPLPEAKPVDTKPVEAKPVEIEPVEAKPAEKKPVKKAEPTRKPPREKAQKADRKQKAEAPKRGNSEVESINGAATASRHATARDGGIGRSREAGTGEAASSNYKGKVRAAIRRTTQMPSKARRLGISGQAHISFTVTPSGAAKNIALARSTGNAMLDDAALSAVRRASLPRMPQGMGELGLTVPIRFEIGG